MNYYISDYHFSHYNVMAKFDKRPFNTTQEMDITMMKNWNNTVTDNDTVYILGDFSWESQEGWKSRLNALNGKKVLITGNHDYKRMKGAHKFFEEVIPYKEIFDGNYKVVMCHYPILAYNKSYMENTYMLYGHVHNNTDESKLILDFVKQLHSLHKNNPSEHGNHGQLINVGCMMPYMDYTPRTIEYLVYKFKMGETLNL